MQGLKEFKTLTEQQAFDLKKTNYTAYCEYLNALAIYNEAERQMRQNDYAHEWHRNNTPHEFDWAQQAQATVEFVIPECLNPDLKHIPEPPQKESMYQEQMQDTNDFIDQTQVYKKQLIQEAARKNVEASFGTHTPESRIVHIHSAKSNRVLVGVIIILMCLLTMIGTYMFVNSACTHTDLFHSSASFSGKVLAFVENLTIFK